MDESFSEEMDIQQNIGNHKQNEMYTLELKNKLYEIKMT